MNKIQFKGSKINEFGGKRNYEFNGKVSIESNLQINSLERLPESKDTIKVDYLFEVNYPELGNVMIEGSIFISSDSKTLKDLQKAWKDKELNNENYIIITNMILQKVSIKAFEIEDELGLPLHIRLPMVELKK